MDEIDKAIAEFEAAKAAKAAKKDKKRTRNNDVTDHIGTDGVSGASTSEKSQTSGKPPPPKKQKISKKGQENAYRAVYGNEPHPSIKLRIDRLKGEDPMLGMKDIRGLITSILANGPTTAWAEIKVQSRLQHVIVIVMDSLSLDLYLDASTSGYMPFLSTHFAMTPSKAPGNATRVFDGTSVLLRHPMSKSTLKNVRKEHLASLAALPQLTVPISDLPNGTESLNLVPKLPLDLTGPTITPEELLERFSISKERSERSLWTEITDVTPGQLLLTLKELESNQYPLSHTITEPGFVEITKYHEELSSVSSNPPTYHILAIDCEMCRTTAGVELTRVVIVNMDLDIVYDSYVKPQAEITDYLTRYSGITKEILEPVSIRLEDVQRDLLRIIEPKTILIGHSLENDLKALKISHHRVIDTALLYPHTRGDTFKNSLKFLAENWLNEAIQTEFGGHSPAQDARTAMKLALLKFRSDPSFGRLPLADKEENLCEYLYRQGKRTYIAASAYVCKKYSGSHTDLDGEESDELVAQKASRAIGSCKYDFLFAALRALQQYYATLESAGSVVQDSVQVAENGNSEFEPMQTDQEASESGNNSANDSGQTPSEAAQLLNLDPSTTTPDRTIEKQICKQFDDYLQAMMQNLPKRSLVIVTGGNGNIARVRSIVNGKRKLQSAGGVWTESDDAKSRALFEKARETVSFFWIPPTENKPVNASKS